MTDPPRDCEPLRAPAPTPPEGPPPSPPLVLGLLGGVASGKSAAARALAGPDGLVLDADLLAHEALRSPEVAERVREAFGARYLAADGAPDRRALAELVFRDPEARSRLEGWIHPLVRARIWERLDQARSAGVARVVLDVPLLLENDEHHGLSRACHYLVYVDADPSLREQRGMRERGWDPAELARRESSQLPLAEKRRRADFVISNQGTLADLERAASDLLRRIER